MSVNYPPVVAAYPSGEAKWEVEGSTPRTSYTVTERLNTKRGSLGAALDTARVDGETYLHCSCPSWTTMIRKGGCKHIIRVAMATGRPTGFGMLANPPQQIVIAVDESSNAASNAASPADMAAVKRLLGIA